MKSEKTLRVARVVLLAPLLVGFAVVSGCGREQSAPAVPATESGTDAPEVYMKDPQFRKSLDEQNKKRNSILSKRSRLKKAIAAEKAKNPVSEKAKALEAELSAENAAFESNRLETAAIIRERLLRKKGTTK